MPLLTIKKVILNVSVVIAPFPKNSYCNECTRILRDTLTLLSGAASIYCGYITCNIAVYTCTY